MIQPLWSVNERNLLHSLLKSEVKNLDWFVDTFNAASPNHRSRGSLAFMIKAGLSAGLYEGEVLNRARTLVSEYARKVRTKTPNVELVARDWATETEAAQLFGYSRSNIALLAKRGKIRRVQNPRMGNMWVYSMDDLNQYCKTYVHRKKYGPTTVKIITPRVEPPASSSFENEVLELVKQGKLTRESALILIKSK